MKVMIIGYGSTGKYVLDFLLSLPEVENMEIVIATRDIEDARKHMNLSVISSGIRSYFPGNVKCLRMDLNYIDNAARILDEEKPDILAYTARWLKGLKYGQYSYPCNIGYGVWSPMSAVLIYKLMQEI